MEPMGNGAAAGREILSAEELAFLGRVTHYWRTVTRTEEGRMVDSLAARGWLQVRRQKRRGFAQLYRLAHSEIPADHPALP